MTIRLLEARFDHLKGYWEKEGALIVNCNDTRDPKVRFHTGEWGIRENVANPKK